MKKRIISSIFILFLGLLGLLITYHVALLDQTDIMLLIICIYIAFISLVYVVGHVVIIILLMIHYFTSK